MSMRCGHLDDQIEYLFNNGVMCFQFMLELDSVPRMNTLLDRTGNGKE